MGLSEREQQLLDELERGLMDSDKGIASKAKRVGNPAAKLIGGALLAVVGLHCWRGWILDHARRTSCCHLKHPASGPKLRFWPIHPKLPKAWS